MKGQTFLLSASGFYIIALPWSWHLHIKPFRHLHIAFVIIFISYKKLIYISSKSPYIFLLLFLLPFLGPVNKVSIVEFPFILLSHLLLRLRVNVYKYDRLLVHYPKLNTIRYIVTFAPSKIDFLADVKFISAGREDVDVKMLGSGIEILFSIYISIITSTLINHEIADLTSKACCTQMDH